ncbi:MAG: pyruvate ferredoxin oxidoreductase subunit gamma [Chloroflexota bacterium]
MVEIRWHGRGGQGAVTSAELIAQAAIAEGKYAQAFPSFGPERRGAPVLAFTRVSAKEPVRIRAEITKPNAVVVLDPSLMEIVDVTAGLKEHGFLVVNTKKTVEQISARFPGKWQVATVDATRIAKELLGVPITNTTMVGAVLKATGVVNLESIAEPLKARFGKLAEKNFAAMKRAYEETVIKE